MRLFTIRLVLKHMFSLQTDEGTRLTVHNRLLKSRFSMKAEYIWIFIHCFFFLYAPKVLKVSGMGSISLYFRLNVIHGLGLR